MMMAAVSMGDQAASSHDVGVPRGLNHRDLITVFNDLFESTLNTQLIGGGHEPIYQPANSENPYHRIIFTRDYAASALHEVAHWCVAGTDRRQLEDYGYWYAPDGRSEEQQQEFELMEVKPQAIEWILSVAAGRQFRVSADNLNGGMGASETFLQAIWQQAQSYCQDGVNDRISLLVAALQQSSGEANAFDLEHYRREPN